MYPTAAPLNGPGSSFDLSQDRLRLAAQLRRLDRALNQMPSVVNPAAVDVVVPTLPATLQLGLSSAQMTIDHKNAIVAPMTVKLTSYCENAVDVVPTGIGSTTDFPTGALVPQAAGAYAGNYQVAGSSLAAASAVDASSGWRLFSSYTGTFAAQAGGWGPAFFDAAGNGYVVRLTPTGGGLFRARSGAAFGSALALLGPNTGAAPGQHTLGLTMRAVGTELELAISIDGKASLTYLDPAPGIAPQSVFPGLACDGGTVYLSSWKWYNENGDPAAGWRVSSFAAGTPAPAVSPGGRRIFVVTTAAAPIDLRVVYHRKQLDNRVAHLRQTLASLKAAYL